MKTNIEKDLTNSRVLKQLVQMHFSVMDLKMMNKRVTEEILLQAQ